MNRHKRYYEANKEKVLARKKAYRDANKEKLAAYNKEYVSAKRDEFYTVYYLPEEHYVGITNQLYVRVKNHRSKGRNVEGHRILFTCETKREALDIERKFHDVLSFNGSNVRK